MERLVAIEQRDRISKGVDELHVLDGDVEPIDPVERREHIAVVDEKRLPVFMVRAILER